MKHRQQDSLRRIRRYSAGHARRLPRPVRRARFRLALESLETRNLLAASFGYDEVSPTWFQTLSPNDQPAQLSGFASATATGLNDTTFSNNPDLRRWVVRFTEESLVGISGVGETESLLAGSNVEFTVIRGLGLTGQIEVQTIEPSESAVVAAFEANPNVAYFFLDSLVVSQALADDPLFDQQWGIDNQGIGPGGSAEGVAGADISGLQAFNITTGNRDTLVTVIDSGIDYRHPDLYENVWINPGEIPSQIAASLIDTDTDGVISFVDLNHPFNADLSTDLNANGYIDAGDLLGDSRWRDGVDTDGNGFVDDLHGYDFHNNDADPFDDSGHGTHVSGTIAAASHNGIGVRGVASNTTLMPLKFLSASDLGATANATRAVNYATMMRTQFGQNVRVINNSWGGERFNLGLREAIATTAKADILFVAGAGNGDIDREGINNDLVPFYPASYDLDNIIAVTATGRNDELAPFANFGAGSVDLAAPGVSILSTLPRGSFGFRHGTSMASAFVTGASALQFSNVPHATSQEVKASILGSVDLLPIPADQSKLVTGGRLNAEAMLQLDTIAPQVFVSVNDDFAFQGTKPATIVVRVTDNEGVDVEESFVDTPGNLAIVRESDASFQVSLQPITIESNADNTSVTATYRFEAPGGSWNVADNDRYQIQLNRDVIDLAGNATGQFVLSLPEFEQQEIIRDAPLDSRFADLNGDDFPDWLQIPFSGQEIQIRFNDGSGRFDEVPIQIPLDGKPASLEVGDFDNSGLPDVVVISVGGIEADLLFNFDGSGFGSQQKLPIAEIPGGGNFPPFFSDVPELRPMLPYVPIDVVAEDLNRDGRLDLAFSLLSHRISVSLNEGDGAFATPVLYETSDRNIDDAILTATDPGEIVLLARGRSHLLAAGDFDGDGDLDLATSSTEALVSFDLTPGVLLITENLGDGAFQSAAVNGSSETFPLEAIEVGDFNNDGIDDVLTSVLGRDKYLISLPGVGDFAERMLPDLGATTTSYAIESVDLDGDGDLDVLRAVAFVEDLNQNGDADDDEPVVVDLRWLDNDGFGQFQQRWIATDLSIDFLGGVIQTADVNGDTWQEVFLLGSGFIESAIPFLNVSQQVADGGFELAAVPLQVTGTADRRLDPLGVPQRPVVPKRTLRSAILEANAAPGLDEIDLPSGTYQLETIFESISSTSPFTSAFDEHVPEAVVFRDEDLAGIGQDEPFKILGIQPPAFGSARLEGPFGDSSIVFTPLAQDSKTLNTFHDSMVVTAGDGFGMTIAIEIEIEYVSGDLRDLDILDDVVIRGSGAGQTIIEANSSDRALSIDADVSVALTDLTVRGGERGLGGIYNAGKLLAERTVITGSRAALGGGLLNRGVAQIVDSTIANNSAFADGGGIFNEGVLEIRSSTISGNAAQTGGGVGHDQIATTGGVTTTIVNSTITANEAIFRGGGLVGADEEPGLPFPQPVIDIRNSVIAGNNAGQEGGDVEGLVEVDGVSLVGLGGSGSSEIDPMLGPLTDNGGPTPTHAPLPGSPLIDAGNSTGAPARDQRGSVRVLDGNADGIAAIDLGAVEFSSFSVTSTRDTPDADPADDQGVDAFGNRTLRAAIGQANASAGPDTITLPTGLFALSRAGRNEDAAVSGDLDIRGDLTLVGQGAEETIIDATSLDRVLDVLPGSTVTLRNLTLRGGNADSGGSPLRGSGGAIRNAGRLILEGVRIVDNEAEQGGGGVHNLIGGVLEIRRSLFEGNHADGRSANGGAIRNEGTLSMDRATLRGNTADSQGGGILNSGTISVQASTISGNTANRGGGILQSAGQTDWQNSTVSANTAAGDGGGVFQVSGSMTIRSSTFANNVAGGIGGGLRNGAGTIRLQRTLVARNVAAENDDLAGNFQSLGNNLIGDAETSTGFIDNANDDIVGVPFGLLGLGPLQDNGGPTETHALTSSSPAVNAGGGANPGTRPRDQRGGPRLADALDIGAYERLDRTIFVRKTVDDSSQIPTDCSDGQCSLREAILFASESSSNQQTTLVLEAGTYKLSIEDVVGQDDSFGYAGDLDIRRPTLITGHSAAETIIDANGISRAFHVSSDAVEISSVTVTGGDTSEIIPNSFSPFDDGGGILNQGTLTLRDSIVSGNRADGSGGGIAARGDSFIYDSTITTNSARGHGGGLYGDGFAHQEIRRTSLLSNTANESGGGFYQNDGSADVMDSTLAFNVARDGGGFYGSNTHLDFGNVTISSNRATRRIGAGGVQGDGQLTFESTTIYGNSAPDVGGIDASLGSFVSVRNTLVAGNVATGITDAVGIVVSEGFNLFGDASATQGLDEPTDQAGNTGGLPIIDPLVGVLVELTQDRGTTLTHALAPGSPAIDAGSSNFVVDQRGVARNTDGDGDGTRQDDIGAFEFVRDDSGPIVIADFQRFISLGSSKHQFIVTYEDDTDLRTLDDNDVFVRTPRINPNTGKPIEIPARLRSFTVDAGIDIDTINAIYEIEPPGGVWDPSDDGRYEVLLRDGEVFDVNGNEALENTPLSGVFQLSPNVQFTGAQFPVVNEFQLISLVSPPRPDGQLIYNVFDAEYFTFSTNPSIELYVDLDGDRLIDEEIDFLVAETDFDTLAGVISVADLPLDRLPSREVIFLAVARGTDLDTGTSVLEDAFGLPAIRTITFIELDGPRAVLNASDLVSSQSDDEYLFSVTYTDESGIDISTLGQTELTVSGPGGFETTAELVNVDVNENGLRRIATYRITPPGGTLSIDDNGFYSVRLNAGLVADVNGNVADSRTLGGFTFEFVIPANVSGSISGRVAEDVDKNGDLAGDPPLAGQRVFLDLNQNGRYDASVEPSDVSDQEGNYTIVYDTVPSGRYAVLYEGNQVVATPQKADFAAQRIESSTADFAISVATGLLDADTFPDLVIANYNAGTLSVRFNDGSGDYRNGATSLPVPAGPYSVQVADLDGALGDDILVVNEINGSVSVYLNDGQGGFGNRVDFPIRLSASLSSAPTYAAIADMDGDDDLDVAVAIRSNAVAILLNEGRSQPEVAAGQPLFGQPLMFGLPAGTRPSAIGIGSFDEDVRPDLAIATVGPSNDSQVTIYFGSPTLTQPVNEASELFSVAGSVSTSFSLPVSEILIGDFKGSPLSDMAVIQKSLDRDEVQGTVSFIRNDGNRNLTLDSETLVGETPFTALGAADIDANGQLDLVVTNNATRNVSLYTRAQSGDFGDKSNVPIAKLPATFQFSVATTDVDADQQADLVVSDSVGVTILRNARGGHIVDLTADLTFTNQDFGLVDPPAASFDYGDAPTSNQSGFASDYPTLLEADGARHRIGTLFLGAEPTDEFDGTPSVSADGDLDDGVVWPVPLITDGSAPGLASIIVEASEAGKLDAWIDFNRDGDWLDAGEQILQSLDVIAGSNLIPFLVPAGAVGGADTFARIRISSLGSLASSGAADDGEVEDYRVGLFDSSTPASIVGLLDILDPITIGLNGSNIQLISGSKTFFSAPRSGVTELRLARLGNFAIDPKQVAINGQFNLSNPNERVLRVGPATEIIDLVSLPNSALSGVEVVDLRSQGDRQLIVDAATIDHLSTNRSLKVISDPGDRISAGTGFTFAQIGRENGRFVHMFANQGTSIVMVGPRDWTNPLNVFDVNQDQRTTVADALVIINELIRRSFSQSDGTLLAPDDVVSLNTVRYYDVSGDDAATAIDALRVINQLIRISARSQGSGEQVSTDFVMDSTLSPSSDRRSQRVMLTESAVESGVDKIVSFGLAERSASPVGQTQPFDDIPGSESSGLSNEEVDQVLGSNWDPFRDGA